MPYIKAKLPKSVQPVLIFQDDRLEVGSVLEKNSAYFAYFVLGFFHGPLNPVNAHRTTATSQSSADARGRFCVVRPPPRVEGSGPI